jgi:hypothetical protein
MPPITSSRVPDLSVLTTPDSASRLASTNPTGLLQSLAQYERERQAANGVVVTNSVTNAITAFATGGQTNGTVLTSNLNRITVCATGGDSVKLPLAAPGLDVIVINDGAASCNVFPFLGDAITTTNTAFAVGIGKTAHFWCASLLKWGANLSA